MMTSSKSSGSVSHPGVLTLKVNAWPDSAGWAPIRPAANWAFCSRSADAMSAGVSSYWAMRSGSNYTRME